MSCARLLSRLLSLSLLVVQLVVEIPRGNYKNASKILHKISTLVMLNRKTAYWNSNES